jgi:hypothetical protein
MAACVQQGGAHLDEAQRHPGAHERLQQAWHELALDAQRQRLQQCLPLHQHTAGSNLKQGPDGVSAQGVWGMRIHLPFTIYHLPCNTRNDAQALGGALNIHVGVDHHLAHKASPRTWVGGQTSPWSSQLW